MADKFLFLKSVRFWKLFVAALVEFLGSQEIIPMALANSIAAWLTASVVVRTIDRVSE